jgi:hypothetical protein
MPENLGAGTIHLDAPWALSAFCASSIGSSCAIISHSTATIRGELEETRARSPTLTANSVAKGRNWVASGAQWADGRSERPRYDSYDRSIHLLRRNMSRRSGNGVNQQTLSRAYQEDTSKNDLG